MLLCEYDKIAFYHFILFAFISFYNINVQLRLYSLLFLAMCASLYKRRCVRSPIGTLCFVFRFICGTRHFSLYSAPSRLIHWDDVYIHIVVCLYCDYLLHLHHPCVPIHILTPTRDLFSHCHYCALLMLYHLPDLTLLLLVASLHANLWASFFSWCYLRITVCLVLFPIPFYLFLHFTSFPSNNMRSRIQHSSFPWEVGCIAGQVLKGGSIFMCLYLCLQKIPQRWQLTGPHGRQAERVWNWPL